MKYYTGIGSRETPEEIGKVMRSLSKKLESLGYILRSGGAGGADTFFAEGCKNKEIFIPWPGFAEDGIVPEYNPFSEIILKEVHPVHSRLTPGAKKLHLRNINQVLGSDLKTPSDFLICWAKTNNLKIPKGGTRTAWVVAQKNNIPCFNMFLPEDLNRFKEFLKTL